MQTRSHTPRAHSHTHTHTHTHTQHTHTHRLKSIVPYSTIVVSMSQMKRPVFKPRERRHLLLLPPVVCFYKGQIPPNAPGGGGGGSHDIIPQPGAVCFNKGQIPDFAPGGGGGGGHVTMIGALLVLPRIHIYICFSKSSSFPRFIPDNHYPKSS